MVTPPNNHLGQIEFSAETTPGSQNQVVTWELQIIDSEGNPILLTHTTHAFPNARVEIHEEPEGEIRVISSGIDANGRSIAIETQSDGLTMLRQTDPDGTFSEVTSSLIGTRLQVLPEGRTITEIPYAGNTGELHIQVETSADGESVVVIKRFDVIANEWIETSRTIDTVKPFERGHRISVGTDGIRVETPVSQDIYF
jgi:hypothetical protein